jgi:aspartyl-tRNA(Asn)/glutamyl-tRNA(Gln) amidotransferase subunit A
MSLAEQTATELKKMIGRGETSSAAIMASVLENIERREHEIGAFITVRPAEELLAEAEAVDRRRAAGEPIGLLDGLPVAIKDNICTKGLRTTCASKMLENFVPPYDATVVRKIREADGLVLGKTNMDEFAMGSSTENSAFKITHNPHDLTRVPGGTSGGSAAAVAAHETILAIGSDTGGSIRQPASFCGVVGMKPTYGRVSRYGLIAYGSSLDQIGPLGKCVEDVALLMNVIAGHDPLDSTSLDAPVPDYLAGLDDCPKLRIGVPREYFGEGLDPEVRAAVERALKLMEADGHTLVPISLPHTEYAIATYYIIACAEASSNLARYDGAQYGFRAAGTGNIIDMFTRTRTEGFGPEVKRRIMLGTYALSAGFYDAYYLKALKARTLILKDFERAFTVCDLIASPVAPTPAYRIGEKSDDPLAMYLGDLYSVTANLTGMPAVSIACGHATKELPIGFMCTSNTLSEMTALAQTNRLERLLQMSDDASANSKGSCQGRRAMKTVTFYSYKGGVGRTLSMVNLALFLARLGKKVVLLDFDFSAPGVASKLGIDDVKCGIVDLIRRYLEIGISTENEADKENLHDKLLGTVADFGRSAPNRQGIFIIPSGNIKELRDFWWLISPRDPEPYKQASPEDSNKTLNTAGELFSGEPNHAASTKWRQFAEINQQFLALFDMSCPKHCDLPDSLLLTKIKFFYGLKKAIETLSFKPDYLFIDAPAGITPFGGAANLVMADSVVCLFGTNAENLDGMENVFDRLVYANDKRQEIESAFGYKLRSLRVYPVITRVPSVLHEKRDPEMAVRIAARFKKWGAQLGFTVPNILHSFMDLELMDELLIGYPQPAGPFGIRKVLLTTELLALLGKMFPDILGEGYTTDSKPEDIVNRLWSLLGIDGEPGIFEITYRIFVLNEIDGTMLNLSDDANNVAFKVKTFRGILSRIYETLPAASVEIAFREAGKTCGEAFGKSLLDTVWRNEQEMSIDQRVKRWCKFDSSVGFGNLASEPVSEQNSESISGWIHVKNNFLARPQDNPADDRVPTANLCALLEGYIQGVLAIILKYDIKVMHHESKCMRCNPAQKSCDFFFAGIPK